MNPSGPAPDNPRAPSLSPVVVAVAGSLSLLVSAAAGWAIRASRHSTSNELMNFSASVDAVAAPAKVDPQGRGKLLFQVHYARCHGSTGHGDGPDSSALRPPPRDLTVGPWRTPATPEAVRRTIAEGVPGTLMVGMAASLSPREIDAVADHVLRLAPAPISLNAADMLKQAGFTPIPPEQSAPTLSARGPDGTTVALDQLRGKLVLVVFWGNESAPCLDEMPDLQSLAARFRNDEFTILPICADETDPALVGRAAAAHAPRFPVYTDPTGMAKLAYDVQALPSAVLIDPLGRLLGRAQGSMRWSAPVMDVLIRACLPSSRRL